MVGYFKKGNQVSVDVPLIMTSLGFCRRLKLFKATVLCTLTRESVPLNFVEITKLGCTLLFMIRVWMECLPLGKEVKQTFWPETSAQQTTLAEHFSIAPGFLLILPHRILNQLIPIEEI